MNQRVEQLRRAGRATILAFESSCDETAVAIVRDGREVLANQILSQIDRHALFGGVVPEIASRMHVEALDPLVDAALAEAGMTLEGIDAVAVTCGPGLVGALLTGVSYAKALAYARGLPLVAVNHIEGHVSANYIAHPQLEPPFVCLVASGGHSHIVLVEHYGKYRLLGQTLDDAAGEAFDKVARVLDIPYPGGPLLDTLRQPGAASPAGDIAASFRRAVVDALVSKSVAAAVEAGASSLAAAGGVAANRLLRRELSRQGGAAGLKVYLPPVALCTDNAAMIGSAAFYRLMRGEVAALDLNALPSLRMFDPTGGDAVGA